MKRLVKRIAGQEKGHGLDLVLTLLGLGGLIMAPLLGLTSTGLLAGQVYEQNTEELYAADAGVEDGIWHLTQGGSVNDTLQLTVNGKAVTVEMEELPHDCNELATYEITSTAVSQDGGTTTVLARVTGITVYMDELLLDHHAGTVYIPNNVYVEGDVTLASEVHIVGDLKAGGNVILNQGSLIGGIVCVAGDLTLNNNATIEAAVYVAGNLVLNNLAIIESDLNVWGTVYLGGSIDVIGDIHANGSVTISSGQGPLVDGNICSNGDVSVNGKSATVDGDVYAGGTITGSGTITGTQCPGGACGVCDVDPCPLGMGWPEIKVWMII
jgi:cytoskeletal protein CcmA (bactofilin family)